MKPYDIDDLRRMLAQPGKTDDEAVLWFHAVNEAEAVREDSTVRDIANMLVGGIPALTIGDVKEWMTTMFEIVYGGDVEKFNADIDRTVEAHLEERK